MTSLPPDIDIPTFAVSVEGTALDGKFGIVSIVTHCEMNRIPFMRMVLVDGDPAESTFPHSEANEFKPGNEIELEAGYKGNNQTLFKGVILSQKIKAGRAKSFLVVEARDSAFKMTLVKRNKLFVDKKDSAAVEEIIGDYNLSNDVETTTAQHPFLVQHHCTDWDFVLSRMQANGKVVVVRDGKLEIKSPDLTSQAVLTLTYGKDIFELEAEMDARHQLKDVKTRSWSHKDQKAEDSDASEPTLNDQGDISPTNLAKASGNQSQVCNQNSNISEDERKAWADGLLLKSRLSKIRGRVNCSGYSKIHPGEVLELDGLGKRFNGKSYVTAVRNEFSEGNWLTDIQFGLNLDLFLDKHLSHAAYPDHLLPGISGLQIAKVLKIAEDPDGEDRIKVHLPMVYESAQEGVWARVATLDAGANRGSFFRPEVDDEVVVGFLNNDPRSVIVLGMLHSSAKAAPLKPDDDSNPIKGFYTRSEMHLLFDDEKKVITIDTPEGNKLILSEENSEVQLVDQNNNKLTMDSGGITLNSCQDINLKAAGKINLNATSDIKQEGLNVEIDAQVGFTAKGNGTAEVSASGQTTIKGAMVMIN